MAKTFKEVFCDTFKCPPEKFEAQVFWKCLYPHAVPGALVIKAFNPDFFRADFELIQLISLDTSFAEIEADVQDFQFANSFGEHWLKKPLRLRLSGRRLLGLASQLYPSKNGVLNL
jgi:hypothetical protein